MSKSLTERVRARIAKQDAARKAAEYKAGEHARRSAAARISARARQDARIDAVIGGRAEPQNARELAALANFERDFDE